MGKKLYYYYINNNKLLEHLKDYLLKNQILQIKISKNNSYQSVDLNRLLKPKTSLADILISTFQVLMSLKNVWKCSNRRIFYYPNFLQEYILSTYQQFSLVWMRGFLVSRWMDLAREMRIQYSEQYFIFASRAVRLFDAMFRSRVIQRMPFYHRKINKMKPYYNIRYDVINYIWDVYINNLFLNLFIVE